MSELSEKVSYLKGLADGLALEPTTEKNKMILAILDVLEAVAKESAAQNEKIDELSEYVEEIDSDLSDLEDSLFEDDDEEDEDEFYDEEDDEDFEAFADNDTIQYECPYCNTVVMYSGEVFDMETEHTCPNCGRKIFEEDTPVTAEKLGEEN